MLLQSSAEGNSLWAIPEAVCKSVLQGALGLHFPRWKKNNKANTKMYSLYFHSNFSLRSM